MRKKIVLAAVVLLSCFGLNTYTGNTAQAQVGVSFNVDAQPLWGPVGYSYARYYYIPDIQAYYDVNDKDFVYQQNGQWITSPTLPEAYADFNLYDAYKVVINSPHPWLNNDMYYDRYYSYRGHMRQPVIRDSHDRRYWANPEHPMHYRYEREGEWGGNRPPHDDR